MRECEGGSAECNIAPEGAEALEVLGAVDVSCIDHVLPSL